MENITQEFLIKTLTDLWKRCTVNLPESVIKVMEKASQSETYPPAKSQIEAMIENARKATKLGLPACQSPGSLISYVRYGTGAGIKADIYKAIVEGVRRATNEGFIRPSMVHPITRENTFDGTGDYMPVIDVDLVLGADDVEITVMMKGFGAENVSDLVVLLPTEVGPNGEGIKKFVLDTLLRARGQACSPFKVGIGIGSTIDCVARLSRFALMRPWGERHIEPIYAKLETELLNAINKLGLGPMYLSGDTTVFDVAIEASFTHVVGLAVACNLQCWCGRQATIKIAANGEVKEVPRPTLPSPQPWRPVGGWPWERKKSS